MNSNTLNIYTTEFPYGNELFLLNELPYAEIFFSKINIIPSVIPKNRNQISLPKNVTVMELERGSDDKFFKVLSGVQNLPFIIQLLIVECFSSRQKSLAFKNAKRNFFLIHALLQRFKANKQFFSESGTTHYSFWFSTDALLLAILKKKKIINRFYSRAHGFDLYENNGKENYLPFRKFLLKQVDGVFCVSKMGMLYLRNLYPQFTYKIGQSYLGVADKGIVNKEPIQDITIVSCSNIVAVKRLHLIVEALKEVKSKLYWVHFGSGDLYEEIVQSCKSLPPNVKVDFKGQVANEKILEFYKNTPISYFINTSISEGLPVSIMEAISFGIPIIATNVGGLSEIVNEQTGYLLDVNFKPQQLVKVIDNYYQMQFSQSGYRENARKFYQLNFNSKINYHQFYNNLKH